MEKTELYRHNVKYYETDRMGITHHSNYVRWMEEARVDYLHHIGCDYAEMESTGVISPVLGVKCEYKMTTAFNDDVDIAVSTAEFNGVRLKLKYEMRMAASGELVCVAESEHCFVEEGSFKPVNLKKRLPQVYDNLCAVVGKE
ncbi:MAG: acyl-CoA thioesterase [Bacteroides sp.]|nr:acyl-CoA thioesterase [Bacteroides sp.]